MAQIVCMENSSLADQFLACLRHNTKKFISPNTSVFSYIIVDILHIHILLTGLKC